MKYVDAERLREKITDRLDLFRELSSDTISPIRIDECKQIIDIIDSLQQEQESVAERFARIIRGNLIGIDKEVQHKFEQLYLEVTGNKMYGGFND